MQIRQSIHSDHAKQLDTQGLRREFLVEEIFTPNKLTMTIILVPKNHPNGTKKGSLYKENSAQG